ncbi:MAG: bifunctional metallophosphatase/5'-nucleotidase, partial [Lentisphaeraceae bacterium]|nr:bifunctional metallophosphatase/5'-nucleotidase [Lentisphaeraceae bacterium]
MQKISISNHYYLTLSLILFLGGQLSAKTVSVRILQTTDIHCHIESSGAQNDEGGWLRLATLVKQHRTEVGRKNTLLIDCGDTIQGSLSALVSKGEAAIDMLNYLQYDFWVPGNHELDFGTRRLEQLLEKTKVKVLNGNFVLNENKRLTFPAWKIVE